jgi:hypothetical protein
MAQAEETSLIDTPGPLTTSSGQHPAGAVVVQSHIDTPGPAKLSSTRK